MSKFLTITDSLSSFAGGLSNASLNHALSMASILKDDTHIILTHKDDCELDSYDISLPPNVLIHKVACFRNPIYPISLEFSNHISSIEPDLVHLRGLWRQGSLASIRWKISHPSRPLIVQTAGMLEPWAFKRNSVLKQIYFTTIEQKLFQLCDLVHATSELEKQTLVSLGISSSKIVVIHEGIFIPPHSAITSTAEMRSLIPFNLLFLSRLHPVKGIDLLLEAWSHLRPSNWKLQIVGTGKQSYIKQLKHFQNNLGLNSCVEFVGPVSGSSKDYMFASASAFVLPSYSESFGIAIAEALSWSLPVITTTSTPWSDLQTFNLGWYVRPDLFHLTKAIYDLTSMSPSNLLSMGATGRKYVEARFSWPVIASDLAKIYQSLLL